MSWLVLLFVALLFIFSLLLVSLLFMSSLYGVRIYAILLAILICLVSLVYIILKPNIVINIRKSSTHIINFITEHSSTFKIVPLLLFVGLLFWLILYSSVINYPQGHITIEMDSVYYKSDEQIPVLISVTGPDTGLSIKLSNTLSDYLNSIALIDKLEQYPNQKIEHDNSLIGYPLGSGKYIVFITTTNLSPGYYKLECTRTKYKLSGAKGFYLSDDSKTQINKAVTAASHYNV